MTPEHLLKHFDRIATAPDAIPRLRRFILDLAVRGRLVEQNSEDESAVEQLKNYKKDKGEIDFISLFSKDDTPPFKISSTWVWARLGRIASVEMGQSPPSEHYNQSGEGMPFYQGKADFGHRNPTPRFWCSQPTKIAKQNDILISIRAPVGPTNVTSEDCCIGRGLAAIRPYTVINLELLLYWLKGFEKKIADMGFGTTFIAINKKQLVSFPLPLPPLAEQHRIVAKVDELMALCDELEAAQTKREKRRDRLVAATLHGINNGETSQEPGPHPSFEESARFYFNHLPRLTTHPEHIQQLRQTILNLAVRGKLVPQDPNDEPVSRLITDVQNKMEHQIIDLLPSVDETSAPFTLPPGWAWERFSSLGIFGRGRSKHRPRNDPSLFEGGTHRFIQTGDVARSNGVIASFTSRYNEAGLEQSKKWPKGTLCITIAANIADSGILEFDACFPDSVVGFIPASPFPNARYFEYFIRTVKSRLLDFAPATAQKNINLGILNELLIPLPPLAELKRIVEKVDKLMSICDELVAGLEAKSKTQGQFLEATLLEALH
jgi:type I restriction enzyme S subunit